MSNSHWRAEANKAIWKVLENIEQPTTLTVVKRAIGEAYPFGPRHNWPYKAWLSEMRRILQGLERNPDWNGPKIIFPARHIAGPLFESEAAK